MRIKKLVFQNINSLYGKWEINFDADEFRQNGLFAITGKTGSGKSTILDAMTIALFGSTPRLNREPIYAVSRGCVECMSELTFVDMHNREWTATYAYETIKKGPKKGSMKENAIHRLSCDGKTAADKTTEVRRMVEEITGLDATRFCRAVLLAQGSFDAFLNAGSENGQILERITGTEIYSRIAAKLKERTDREKSKLAEIELIFKEIKLMPDDMAEEKRNEAAELEKQIAEFTARQKVLNSLMTSFQELERHRSALEKCQESETLLENDEKTFAPKRQRLEEGMKALEADKFYRPYNELQQSQNVANAALQKNTLLLKEQEELCVKAGKELENARLNAEEFREEFEKLNQLLTAVRALDQAVELLKNNADAAREKRTVSIRQALEIRKELRKSEAQLEALQKEHSQGIAYLNTHAADGELQGVQTLCAEWLEALKKIAIEVESTSRRELSCKKNLQELNKKHAERQKLFEAEEKKFADLSARHEKAGAELKALLNGSTKEHWSALIEKQQQICQQSLLLRSFDEHRKKLKAGSPCPLCGSTEHPFALECNAEPEKEALELEKLKKLLDQISTAEEQLQKLANSLEICRNAKLQHNEMLKEAASQIAAAENEVKLNGEKLQTLRDELKATEAKIDEALAPYGISREKDKNTLPAEVASRIKAYNQHKIARDEFENKKQTLQNALLRLQTSFTNQLGNCRLLKKEEQSEKAKLASEIWKRQELFGTRDTGSAAKQAEDKRKKLADVFEQAQKSSTVAHTNCDRTRTEIKNLENAVAERAAAIISAKDLFIHACETCGLTEEMFHACVLEKEEMAALTAEDTELKARKKQLAETRKSCEEAITHLKQLLENQPEKEKVSQELAEINGKFQEKNQTLGALREQLKQDADAKVRMAEQHEKLLKQQEVARLWGRMYELIGSKDKFQRYAQGITLEHLLVLANLELAKLSDRYRLLRSKTEELGIDVADKDQGDEIRRCQTLSGGERFLVSLALALGLSQMAGEKIRVDSLFLDEGFGTLDSETLETALAALSSLRNRGKLVGVISHVAELSEKIPCSIQVTKRGGGRSTIQGPGVRQLTKKEA